MREKARRASTWDDLRSVIDEAQAAFDAGEATGEEVESLSGYAWDRSRQIPEGGDGERLSELLARQPVVRVRSRLLGEVVVWVAAAAEVPEDISEVVYREAELRRMVGRPAAEVLAIHEAKRSFDGELAE